MNQPTLWDNSNIAESYAGVTTPLTISFAKRVYREVYRGMAHASGLSWSMIDQQDDIFSQLVDSRYGRLYYNMLNWYRFAALFPGFQKNTQNLDRMLTVPRLHDLRRERQPSWWFRLWYPLILGWRALTISNDIKRFQAKVDTLLRQAIPNDAVHLQAGNTWQQFTTLADQLLPIWHIATDNDFMVMTYAGALTGIANRHGGKQNAALPISWLAQRSTLPGQFLALNKLRSSISEDEQAAGLLKAKKDKELWKYLYTHPESTAGRIFYDYLVHFGARLPNELKLETPSLEEQPQQLFDLLRSSADFSYPAPGPAEKFPGQRGFRRLVAGWLSRRVKIHLGYREQTRLLRARVFDTVRRLMLTIGTAWQESGIVSDRHDIFWVNLEEIPLVTDGTISIPDIQRKIAERRNQFSGFEREKAPNRFWEENGRVTKVEDKPEVLSTEGWQGLGVSAGQVQGRALVLEHPDASLVRPGDILVTKHTDPGWTPLFGLVAGAVVEFGGLLSHASIVAREYQLPCVVQIPGITAALKTGQRIIVDGSTGKVRLV